MIICSDGFFERLGKGNLSAVEKRRYLICQMAQTALEEVPVFYHAQPQGVETPAVFVRIAKIQYHKRLAREIECRLVFELRYLAKNCYDDGECENAMERLMDVFGDDLFVKEAVFAERTDKGAVIKVISKLRWKTENDDDNGELMRLLEMNEKDNGDGKE